MARRTSRVSKTATLTAPPPPLTEKALSIPEPPVRRSNTVVRDPTPPLTPDPIPSPLPAAKSPAAREVPAALPVAEAPATPAIPAEPKTEPALPASSADEPVFVAPHAAQPEPPPVPDTPEPTKPAPVVRDDSHLPPLLFEVGWEVCWQLGGIYTVLRSKAPAMQARWGERYTLVGPYNPKTAAMEFEATEPDPLLKQLIERLRDRGITAHHGRWLVTGRPRVLLLDHRNRFSSLAEDKFLLWKDHGIATEAGDGEVNEVVSFGFACAMMFQELSAIANKRPILGHFHEWMGGVAVPRIAHLRLPVQTIFTTHATLLGRYLAGDNPYFYDHLPFVDPDAEAKHFNIYPRYQLEKAAAHAATVFTTVSEVTALEAEKLLKRTPEVIMPNGLNIQRFHATHEFQNLHNYYKERIHDFVRGHFFPSYNFDLDNTIYLLTSGRYEYRNKGMDMYIEMLARLNQRLKEWKTRPTIVAFIITRAPIKNINVRTLQSQTMYEDLRHVCEEMQTQMGSALFKAAASGRLPKPDELLTEDNVIRLKRALAAMKSPELPTIVTHDMVNDGTDAVLNHVRHKGLFNHPDDPVKVVFHPDFVTATSPLLGLDYEQFVRGCHMGIFPSYYEPWGYTPMECIALGIPACTTDLSGFGAYVMKHVELAAMQGIMVVRRRNRPFDAVVDDMTDHLLNFCRMNRRQRIDQRNRVERLSEMFDWSTLVRHYHEAHDLALARGRAPTEGHVQVVLV